MRRRRRGRHVLSDEQDTPPAGIRADWQDPIFRALVIIPVLLAALMVTVVIAAAVALASPSPAP